MKRAEVLKAKGPVVIRKYDKIPEAPEEGVVVKTSFAGICHSDIHLWDDLVDDGKTVTAMSTKVLPYKYPIVLGHEISGEIHSMGRNSGKDFKIGDKVLVFPWIGCNKCGCCKTGDSNYCKITETSLGLGTDGGFSEYVVVSHSHFLVKVPTGLPMDVATMLPCSGITTYNAVTTVKPIVERFVQRNGRASLLIIGAGGLGLWCIQIAKAALPKNTKIISADIAQDKLDNARAHGADDTVLWDPAMGVDEIVRITQAKGHGGDIDAVIDLVNSTVTSPRGYNSLVKGGAMAVVGLFGGGLNLPLPIHALQLKQVLGVYVGTIQQLRELVDLVHKSKLQPPNLTFVNLEDVEETMNKLRRGEIMGRCLIKF